MRYKIGKKHILKSEHRTVMINVNNIFITDAHAKKYREINEILTVLSSKKLRYLPYLSAKYCNKARIKDLAKAIFDIVTINQSLLYRTVEIQNGIALLINSHNLLAAMILSRCLIENAAKVTEVCICLEDCIQNHDLQDLAKNVERIMLSNRWRDVGKEFSSKNILTLIGKLDENLFGGGKALVRECYDNLSEFSHPNWAGTAGYFSTNNQFFGGRNLSVPIDNWCGIHDYLIGACNALFIVSSVLEMIDRHIVKILDLWIHSKQLPS